MRPRVTVTTNVLGNAPYQLDSPPDHAEGEYKAQGAAGDSPGMGTEIYRSVGRSWSYCENLRSEIGVQYFHGAEIRDIYDIFRFCKPIPI